MSQHFEMSASAADKRADRDLGGHTRKATPEERAAIIREQIRINGDFVSPDTLERWQAELDKLEKEIRPEQ